MRFVRSVLQRRLLASLARLAIRVALNLLYFVVLVVASPWLIYEAINSGKYRSGLAQRLLGLVPRCTGRSVWFHGVSVGEVLLLREMIRLLTQRNPGIEIVISTTTDAGMEVARKEFPGCRVTYFPLDFSWAVRRAIKRARPALVVLAELELWPNFIAAANQFGAQVALVNGRMSPSSYKGYKWISWFMRPLLGQLGLLAVQTEQYGRWFRDIGAPQERIFVVGSGKYDGLITERNNSATTKLRNLFGIEPEEIVWVAGSTSGPEEEIVLRTYNALKSDWPALRLILVPRHRERFEHALRIIATCGLPVMKRSLLVDAEFQAGSWQKPVILVDTIGELAAVWGLADIAFVGGSFALRGGQNMIEPAAYGAAVLFGPSVWNFQDTTALLLKHNAAIQVNDPSEMKRVIARLLRNPNERTTLGTRAQQVVLEQQGASLRTIQLLEHLLPSSSDERRAA